VTGLLSSVPAGLARIAFQRRCRRQAYGGCGSEEAALLPETNKHLDTRRRAGCRGVYRAAATRYGGPQGRPRGGGCTKKHSAVSIRQSAKATAQKRTNKVWVELPKSAWQRTYSRGPSTPRSRAILETSFGSASPRVTVGGGLHKKINVSAGCVCQDVLFRD
jgi:hypothetical protein